MTDPKDAGSDNLNWIHMAHDTCKCLDLRNTVIYIQGSTKCREIS